MTKARSVLLILILSTALILTLGPNLRKAMALPTLATNTDDTYSNNWVGLRPQGNLETVNLNQRVTSRSTDSSVEAMLSAEISNLQTGNPSDPNNPYDQVKLGFTFNTNSRYGVQYSYSGPSTLPFPYSINTATNLGINCSGCGTWLTLQAPIVFYGAPAGLGGSYSKVWVSSDGYISVLGPSTPGKLGPGVIAAFSRPLNPGAGGGVYTWFDSSTGGDTFIAWNNVPTNLPGGNLESFFMQLHYWNAPSLGSPYLESGLEFWYNSITPSDRVATAVGIANQYGVRQVSVPASTLSNNHRVIIQATSGVMYLNSLQVSIVDTSRGATDSKARLVFDPFYNPPGNPVGYNVLLLNTVPGTITLPDYARLALSGAGLVAGLATGGLATAGDIIDTGSGGVLFGVDTYDQLVTAYWSPKLLSETSQSAFGDTTNAFIRAYAAEGGASIPAINPVDASLGAKIVWLFNDGARNVPHHLTLTATVGYIGGSGSTAIGGSDSFTLSTSVDLEIDPDFKLFSTGFEGSLSPFTSPSGTSPWTVTNQCPNGSCFQGTYSAYGQEGSGANYQMVLNTGNFVNYNQIVVYIHLWVSTASDTLYIDYLNSGAWSTVAQYHGMVSNSGSRSLTAYTQWINPRLVLPSTTTAIRFSFPALCCAPSASTPGVYVDDFYLFADGSGSPADSANVDVTGLSNTGSAISPPTSMDSGAFYAAPDHFLASFASHTFNVQTSYTDNTGSYGFTKWSDGVTTASRTITVPATTTLTALYNVIPDFAMSANPTSLGIYANATGSFTTLTLTSRNGFAATVSLSATSSPSGVSINCPPSVTLTAGSTVTVTCPISSSTPGSYTGTITATGGGIIVSVQLSINVCCSGSACCIQGSLSYGTLITMAGGATIPVQNLQVGDLLRGYDPATGKYTTSTVTAIKFVTTNNMLIVNTETGTPLRVDASPTEVLWTKLSDGTTLWLSVTQLQVGDSLFTQNGWVRVTSIEFALGGSHVMYDITATVPYFANGYLDPPHPS